MRKNKSRFEAAVKGLTRSYITIIPAGSSCTVAGSSREEFPSETGWSTNDRSAVEDLSCVIFDNAEEVDDEFADLEESQQQYKSS